MTYMFQLQNQVLTRLNCSFRRKETKSFTPRNRLAVETVKARPDGDYEQGNYGGEASHQRRWPATRRRSESPEKLACDAAEKIRRRDDAPKKKSRRRLGKTKETMYRLGLFWRERTIGHKVELFVGYWA
ncbi:unnamed protein product [Cochlearia groenlandica]